MTPPRAPAGSGPPADAPFDFRWKAVGLGYLVAAAVTIAAGIPLLVFTGSSWLLVVASLAALLAAGFVVGGRSGPQLSAINGALMGISFFFTTALALGVGWFFQWLPEPLPGLPQGDSTFFFAWPLLQVVVSVGGAILGGRAMRKATKGT